jgi:hypothetical protein
LREREVEMANRDVTRRRSGIVALIAVIAAFAAPSAASATPGKSRNFESDPAVAVAPTVLPELTIITDVVADASWADASWADASGADASWAE